MACVVDRVFNCGAFQEPEKHYEILAGARPGLESEFRHEIDATIDRIADSPLLLPLVEAHIRRCIVRRFQRSGPSSRKSHSTRDHCVGDWFDNNRPYSRDRAAGG